MRNFIFWFLLFFWFFWSIWHFILFLNHIILKLLYLCQFIFLILIKIFYWRYSNFLSILRAWWRWGWGRGTTLIFFLWLYISFFTINVNNFLPNFLLFFFQLFSIFFHGIKEMSSLLSFIQIRLSIYETFLSTIFIFFLIARSSFD